PMSNYTLSLHDALPISHNTAPLVDHVPAMLRWIDDGQFVYRDHDAGGDRFLRVDAVRGGVVPAFDHVKLARALGDAAGKPVKAEDRKSTRLNSSHVKIS